MGREWAGSGQAVDRKRTSCLNQSGRVVGSGARQGRKKTHQWGQAGRRKSGERGLKIVSHAVPQVALKRCLTRPHAPPAHVTKQALSQHPSITSPSAAPAGLCAVSVDPVHTRQPVTRGIRARLGTVHGPRDTWTLLSVGHPLTPLPGSPTRKPSAHKAINASAALLTHLPLPHADHSQAIHVDTPCRAPPYARGSTTREPPLTRTSPWRTPAAADREMPALCAVRGSRAHTPYIATVPI